MEIGSLCEAKWSAISEAAAWSAYERQPHIEDIREEQGRLNAIPVKMRSRQNSAPASAKQTDRLSVGETIREASQEIDAVLSSAGASRYSSIPIRRPQRAKEGILEEVLESIGRVIPEKTVTKRMVKKCWDEFRSVQARMKSELT